MSVRIGRWIAGAFLLAALAWTAPVVQAQSRTPYDSSLGIVVAPDRSELRAWKDQVERDKLALREDIRSFGENSAQVRADRLQLGRDERALERARRNLEVARNFVITKHYLWRQ